MVTHFKKAKKEGKFQTVFFSVLIGVFLVGVVSFLIISNLNIGQKRTEMINRIEELKKEIQILEEKNQNLRAGIIETESDIYWEEKMREQGYKKPGEEAVVVLPPEEEGEGVIEKEKSLWQKIKEKLGF